jgi:hypothetical protein
MTDELTDARGRYAHDLKLKAAISSTGIIEAFPAVPRERFLGSGPGV